MLQVRAEADAARARICGPTRAAKSDHVATVYAFNEFRRVRGDRGLRGARHWCGDNFVSFDAMEAIAAGRGEYANCLAELNFVTHGMLPCCQWPHTETKVPFCLRAICVTIPAVFRSRLKLSNQSCSARVEAGLACQAASVCRVRAANAPAR